MDDRRYLCECIVVSTNLKKIINEIKQPDDLNHQIVYIINSNFFKNHILDMRIASKNKIVLCDFLIEIKFINNIKTVKYLKNINIEITSRCPHENVINFILDNTFILCASFGKIKKNPQVQLGITEGAFINDINYKDDNKIPSKPSNSSWKYITSNRGIKEELGLYNNVTWNCINESLFNWNNKHIWVATLISYI